jgi:hypothetical protein
MGLSIYAQGTSAYAASTLLGAATTAGLVQSAFSGDAGVDGYEEVGGSASKESPRSSRFAPFSKLKSFFRPRDPGGSNKKAKSPPPETVPGMEIIPHAALMAKEVGTLLNPLNPIHTLFFRELPLTSTETVASAYRKIEEVLAHTCRRLMIWSAAGHEIDPQRCIGAIHMAMKDAGLSYFESRADIDAAQGMTTAEYIVEGVLHCWPSSLVRLAVSYEMGWPVYLVHAPSHVFVRWDDGVERLSADYEYFSDDEYYRERFDISQRAVEDGVYLKDLNRTELEGLYIISGRKDEATPEAEIARLKKAMELNPNYARAWAVLAVNQFKLDMFEEARESISKIEFYEPDNIVFLNLSARIHKKLGDKSGLRKKYERIVELSSKVDEKGRVGDAADSYFSYGWANLSLGNHRASVDWFTRAIELTTNTKSRSYSHMNRGTSKILTWKPISGLMDYVMGGYFYLKYLGEKFTGVLKRIFR